MNTAAHIDLKDKIVEARKAQFRVRKMYQQNENYDLGALYVYLYEYVDAVGFRAPTLVSTFLTPFTFETWLNDLDKWFLTVADLFYVDLPKEE